jgi:hypothetical protein
MPDGRRKSLSLISKTPKPTFKVTMIVRDHELNTCLSIEEFLKVQVEALDSVQIKVIKLSSGEKRTCRSLSHTRGC